MLRRHIACQRNSQAARLLHNKCRDRATQRPYVRLRSLAYVTGDMPRGSIGPPHERGAEVYIVWYGHVSAPDPAWPWLRPRYSLSQNPGTLLRVVRTLHREVWDPSRGSGLYARRSWTLPGGPVRIWWRPTLSYGGPDPLLIPWRILSSLTTWRPRSRPRGGDGYCLPCDWE
jgi:hypothetical protein